MPAQVYPNPSQSSIYLPNLPSLTCTQSSVCYHRPYKAESRCVNTAFSTKHQLVWSYQTRSADLCFARVSQGASRIRDDSGRRYIIIKISAWPHQLFQWSIQRRARILEVITLIRLTMQGQLHHEKSAPHMLLAARMRHPARCRCVPPCVRLIMPQWGSLRIDTAASEQLADWFSPTHSLHLKR